MFLPEILFLEFSPRIQHFNGKSITLFVPVPNLARISLFSLYFSFVALIPIFELERLNGVKKMDKDPIPRFGTVISRYHRHMLVPQSGPSFRDIS